MSFTRLGLVAVGAPSWCRVRRKGCGTSTDRATLDVVAPCQETRHIWCADCRPSGALWRGMRRQGAVERAPIYKVCRRGRRRRVGAGFGHGPPSPDHATPRRHSPQKPYAAIRLYCPHGWRIAGGNRHAKRPHVRRCREGGGLPDDCRHTGRVPVSPADCGKAPYR